MSGAIKISGKYLVHCLITMVAISVFFPSCISPQKIKYFTDLPDTIKAEQPVVLQATPYEDPRILPNDVLLITLQTSAQGESNTPINTPTVATFNPLSGTLVDKNGNVEIALIGYVKLGGLTTLEARELIKQKAKEFYKDPIVSVRIANFDVTILGDISAPGTYSFPSEKVNIFEAIAAGHDIAITGRRDNILLVRTEGQNKKFIRFNLSSSETFRSPYLYMRQRDLVYVEPFDFKIRQADQTLLRNISIISSILSLATLTLAYRNYKF